MRTLIQDLRYGARVLLKNPGFTLVTVLMLAIGIAANTCIFSWVDAVLLRPLPGVTKAGELVAFETLTPSGEAVTTSYADFRDFRDHANLLAGLTVAQPRTFSVGEEEGAERVWGELVAGNYFDVLGVQPILGRTFTRDEYGDAQGAYPVTVISEGLWRRRFQSDPKVTGKTIRVNRQQLTIIGVISNEFHGAIPGLAFEMWAPAMMGQALNLMPDWMMRDRQTRSFISIARLKPGVTMDQARAEIAGIARELGRSYPKTNEGISANVLPLWKAHFGAQNLLLAPLRILMAVSLVVLLIVCSNVANLLLARASARRKEFSLRMSLGAGRTRLFRQLLTETLLLAVLSALAGVPLALWMARSLQFLLPPSQFPFALDLRMNGDILAFTILVCAGACLLSGVIPAAQAVHGSVVESLKDGGRSGTATAGSQRVRGALVVAEVALALVALIGAGLFTKSFQVARQLNPGFDPKQVVVSHLALSTAGYPVPERILFCRNLADRLKAQPGVTAVTYADAIPLGFDSGAWEDVQIEGYVPSPAENMKIYRNVIAPGYFDVLRIPLLEGRDFTERDDNTAGTLPVMIVNETFARRFLAGRNPIGYKVHGWGRWYTIVGIAKDSKYHTPNESPAPYFYVPFRQVYRADLDIAFYVRTAGDPGQFLSVLRRETRQLDPNVGIFGAMPLSDFIGASLFGQRVAAAMLAALGALSLLLAGLGLYSVIAYSISQRTREIGIRMALGASPWDVVGLVVRHGMRLTALGLVIGVLAAVAVTRVGAALLVNVSSTDPVIFAAAAGFLAAVALLASYIPAKRAMRIDPNDALRSE